MRTRQGLDWTAKFASIADAAGSLPDCIIDGEVVALDHNGAPDFSALQAALSEGRSGDLVYFVFDLLFEGGEDLRQLPLTQRKERLKRLLGREGAHDAHIKYIEHLAEAGDAVLKSACSLNLEGIISKRAAAAFATFAALQLPRLNLCISRSTSLDALGEYFLAMRNPPQGTRGPLVKWVTRETKSRTRKTKNKIFAMPADAPAIPPNPKAAATSATIKNTRAQYSMVASPFPSGEQVCRLRS
jgi:hypothetical protein